ncbi:DUF4917 family protein [Aeromonas caviae]|nr:DUF4917 family protein [Aeromonas caviae]
MASCVAVLFGDKIRSQSKPFLYLFQLVAAKDPVHEQVLPSPRDSITIYGWSIGKQDSHILQQLALAKCPRAAVSVFVGDKTGEEIKSEITHMRKMLKEHAGIENVEFFDAASAGCWNHAG